ncbi:hypothetical protein ACFLW2_03015 [Chloroflexota bacterium]
MITKPAIWKQRLKKDFADLKGILSSEESLDYEYFNLHVQRFMFVAALIIRKLDEAYELSDELMAQKYPCIKHKQQRKRDNLSIFYLKGFSNSNSFMGEPTCSPLMFYDTWHQEKAKLTIKEFCNTIVHSAVFWSNKKYKENKLLGIYVNSRYTKDRYVYYVKFSTIAKLINDVVRDKIRSLHVVIPEEEIKKSRVKGIAGKLRLAKFNKKSGKYDLPSDQKNDID